MKKTLIITASLLATFYFSACGGTDSSASEHQVENVQEALKESNFNAGIIYEALSQSGLGMKLLSNGTTLTAGTYSIDIDVTSENDGNYSLDGYSGKLDSETTQQLLEYVLNNYLSNFDFDYDDTSCVIIYKENSTVAFPSTVFWSYDDNYTCAGRSGNGVRGNDSEAAIEELMSEYE